MDGTIRSPFGEELPLLREIWDSSFSQDDKELFFKNFFNPDMCKVAICDGRPVCAGYLIHVGDYISGGGKYPCAFIYAVAAIPEYRNRGFGSAVVRELINAGRSIGFPAIALCPSTDELFEYYNKRSSLREWFYMNEMQLLTPQHHCELQPTTNETPEITQISDEEYADSRSNLLSGIPHIRLSSHALTYQVQLCSLYGGGLFSVKTPDGFACAIVEVQHDGAVYVKELLSPPQQEQAVISAITKKFPSTDYTIRTPVTQAAITANKRRFAMLAVTDDFPDSPAPTDFQAWCGLAFD